MYKNILFLVVFILGLTVQVSVSATPRVATTTTSWLKRYPKDKKRSGRYIHRPNYTRYKGPGSPNRGVIALFR